MIGYLLPLIGKVVCATSICIFLAMLFAAPTHAGWTQKAGKGFFSKSLSQFESRHFVDDDGNATRQFPFVKRHVNLYGEFGWTDDLTIGTNIFLEQYSTYTITSFPTLNLIIVDEQRSYALTDTEFFLRKKLWEGHGAALALQPLVKLPTWYNSNALIGGTDEFDLEMRLQGGYGFDALDQHHYARLDVAYRHRMGEWRDQLKVDATLGWELNDQITLMPQFFLTRRVEGTARATGSSSAVNDYDLLKGQFSVLYDWNDKTTLQLGAFSHLHARNTGDGEGITLGVWYRF